MNQRNAFALKRQKSQSETEIRNILINIQCQTIEKAKRKKSQSQEKLLECSENKENQDDKLSQVEFQASSNTCVNYEQVASLLSICTSDSNLSLEDEHEIWDDTSDLRVLKIVLDDQKPSIGGFPGQQQCIKNEEVIQTAVNYASTNKYLFKKYFPSKKIVFEDDIEIMISNYLQ